LKLSDDVIEEVSTIIAAIWRGFVFAAPAPVFLSQNRRFELHKRGQLFIRTHNETLSIAAMRVNNPDRSALGING